MAYIKPIQQASQLTEKQKGLFIALTYLNDGAQPVDDFKTLLISIPQTRQHFHMLRQMLLRDGLVCGQYRIRHTYWLYPAFEIEDVQELVRMGLLIRLWKGLYKTTDLALQIAHELRYGA